MLYHPIFIHFPIAFYILELFLLILWQMKHDEFYRRFALFVFRLGYLFMITAVLSGLKDAGGIEHLLTHVRNHFFSAVALFIIYTVRALYWKFGKHQKSYAKILLASAMLGVLAVMVTGYFGGELVYGGE